MNQADTDWPIIHRYTRAQAIADGVLVDVTEVAREAGFVVPVALTSGVWGLVEPTEEEESYGQDAHGRLWDVLWMGFWAIRRAGKSAPERLEYGCYFESRGRPGERQGTRLKKLVFHSGPGDEGEHVITIMLPHED